MRKVLICISIVFFHTSFAGIHDVSRIRTLFHQAVVNEQSAKEMLNLVNSIEVNDQPLLQGYKGVAYMLLAKHSINPFAKLKYFQLGKGYIDAAIRCDENEVELRYLRFAIQTSVPAFLNYNLNIEEDKNDIINNLNNVKDKDLKREMVKFLSESTRCNTEELKLLLISQQVQSRYN